MSIKSQRKTFSIMCSTHLIYIFSSKYLLTESSYIMQAGKSGAFIKDSVDQVYFKWLPFFDTEIIDPNLSIIVASHHGSDFIIRSIRNQLCFCDCLLSPNIMHAGKLLSLFYIVIVFNKILL